MKKKPVVPELSQTGRRNPDKYASWALGGSGMKRLFFGSVALLALAVAGPAIAADMPVRSAVYKAPPATVTAHNWTGFYVGGHCGGAWGRTSAHTIDDDDIFDNRLSPNGGFCGGQVGHNWQWSSWVFGLEGDLGHLWLKKEEIQPSDPGATALRSVKYGWYGTVTGRAGYAWDQWLLYLKGGVGFARIRHGGYEVVGDLGSNAYDISKTRTGGAIGGGLEYAMSPSWSWKIEYLYMDFGHSTTITSDPAVTVENRDHVHTVKLGVNYRFGDFGKGPVVTRY